MAQEQAHLLLPSPQGVEILSQCKVLERGIFTMNILIVLNQSNQQSEVPQVHNSKLISYQAFIFREI